MRITEIDLQCEDIIWFGIDRNSYIFECTSAGCGNVPESVCKSKENTKLLESFFLNNLNEEEKNKLPELSIALSQKGIFCYDIYSENERLYSRIATPEVPLEFYNLPENIQKIIEENKFDIDVVHDEIINIKHAY